MTVRLRNISEHLQTVTIVRPNQVIEHAVYPLNYLNLSDEEYPLINPPLVPGVWEIDLGNAIVPIAPPPSTSQFVTDGENIGSGTPIFKHKVGSNLQFRSLTAGPNVYLSTLNDDVIISSSAEVNTASNSSSGTGTGLIFKTKVGVDLVFKKILAGTNITVTNGSDDITISGVAASNISALNIGSTGAAGVAVPYAREDHVHKGVFTVKKNGSPDIHGTVTLTAGPNVILTQTANNITIDSFNNLIADVTLSSAQILALHTTPVVLVSAPGPGMYHVVDSCEIFLDYNSSPYIGGADVSIDYITTPIFNLFLDQGCLLATSDSRRYGEPVDNPLPDVTELSINEDIVISTSVAFTGGDSILKVRLRYRTYTAIT